ncbi:MAG: hypothetical protein V1712_02375 [Patescibacteria group bacterium]
MTNDINKLVLIRQLVEAARNNLDTATQLLKNLGVDAMEAHGVEAPNTAVQHTDQGAVIIEGVFDGQNMVGPDGKLYSVPANYASKSKLVEGDLLKLTISPDGSFIYKQIGPVERERIVGVLTKDEQTDEFKVLSRGQYFKILLASVTYFKGDLGDEIVILVPKSTPSTWAAVENVIKKHSLSENEPLTTELEAESEVKKSSKPKRRSAKKADSEAFEERQSSAAKGIIEI